MAKGSDADALQNAGRVFRLPGGELSHQLRVHRATLINLVYSFVSGAWYLFRRPHKLYSMYQSRKLDSTRRPRKLDRGIYPEVYLVVP